MENTLKTSEKIGLLNGVGSAREALLERLSIRTVGDMLMHVPARFLDRRTIIPIAELRLGTDAVVSGRITGLSRRPRGRGPSFSAVLSDHSGSITLTFFRPGFPGSKLQQGMDVIACGRIDSYKGYTIVHPELYFNEEAAGAVKAPGMLPVYRLTAGLTQGVMRKLAASALDAVKNSMADILPDELIISGGFKCRWDVFNAAHRPDSPEESKLARDLLALEELYLYRSVLAAIRMKGSQHPGITLSSFSLSEFQASLLWPLTAAQKRVCLEISADMAGGVPMRRLVQGDVGSGKTVVAAFACITSALNGKTAAVLAPTEVLATQHFRSMGEFCSRFGIKVHLLTGGTPGTERKKIAERLTENTGCVLVGTHAILEDWIPLNSVALVVIDEQHRFGVAQREKLLASRNPRPHALVMSATPIPRTLAMTFYGDLELSVIDSMPPGRGITETRIVDHSEKPTVFKFMLERLEAGERIFLVYPLKEASEKSDLRDAATAFETVKSGPMAKFGTALLHGSMSPAEKVAVTEQFSSGQISVLVSTTVIEVGIDVPEATVMVISNAERFGLSQLHQLRGRVGRGGKNSWCFLVPEDGASRESFHRLELLVSTSNGFIIAEKDLAIRGPGQVLGTAQHGIPCFKVANLSIDAHLVRAVSEMQPMTIQVVHGLLKSQLWRYNEMKLPSV